jgi:archaetidylinositol phosphate synthase
MLSTLKPRIEKPLQPVARLFAHVSPNTITFIGMIFPVLFFVAMQHKAYWLALFFLICTVGDLLDGMVARSQHKVSPFGGFLDSTVDRFADFAVIAAFGFAGIIGWNIILPSILCAYLISYMRSRIELAANNKLTANVGFMERPERLIGIGLALVLYALFPHNLVFHQNIASLIFIIMIALSLVTIGQRYQFAYKKL